MEGYERENLIKELYSSFQSNPLPDQKEKPYFFDESTGTWYALTGKTKIERPSLEGALKYYKKIKFRNLFIFQKEYLTDK